MGAEVGRGARRRTTREVDSEAGWTAAQVKDASVRGDSSRRAAEGLGRPGGLPEDFDAWFRDHREAVYRYVRFRVASREIAEDVTSEVFLKALRSLSRYDRSRSAPRTWLLRIARNALTDHLRRLKRRRALHVPVERAPDLASSGPSQEERLLQAERMQTIINGVTTLRKADQDILSLRYGAELANREIAETLDISVNAVAVRLHRALRRLREAVETKSGGTKTR